MRQKSSRVSAVALLAGLLWGGVAHAQFVKTTVASASTSSTGFVDVSGGSLVFTPASLTDVWVVLLSGRLRSTHTSAAVAAEVRFSAEAERRYWVVGP